MAITADDLLESTKRRIGFDPAPQLEDEDLLKLGDEEIVGTLYPLVLKSQGDYYLHTRDYDITADYSRYRQPARMYGPIKDVLLVTADDTEGSSLAVVNIEELGHLSDSAGGEFVCFVDGDFIGLFPAPRTTRHTLRVRYPRHPNALCLLEDARRITAVDLEAGTVQCTTPDTLWDEGTSELDIIGAGNTHQVLAEKLLISDITGSTITFSEDLVGTGVQVGDYLASEGQSPIVQIPDHMVPLLAARLAMLALNAVGDQAGFARAAGLSLTLEKKAESAMAPRVEAEPMIIVPRGSALRARGRW